MRGVRKRKNVLAILGLGIVSCVQHTNAASAENLFVRVVSSTPEVVRIVDFGNDFYVIVTNGNRKIKPKLSIQPLLPWILVKPHSSLPTVDIGSTLSYRVKEDSGSEDGSGGSVKVVKLDIEQSEVNVCHKKTSCSLNLTSDSDPKDSVNWSSVPAGISGRGGSITFNPSSLAAGEYTVKAQSELDSDIRDYCTVRIVSIEFKDVPFALARGGTCRAEAHEVVCRVSVVPENFSPVTYTISGESHGAQIESSTGRVTPGVSNSGQIKLIASVKLLPDCVAETNMLIRAIPVALKSSKVTPLVNDTFRYGGRWLHTFSSSGGSLNGVQIAECVRIQGRNPFVFNNNVDLSGSDVWLLDEKGEMDAPDCYFSGKTWFDATNFLPSPPNEGLPQTATESQYYYWRCDLENRWIEFAEGSIKTSLRFDSQGDIVVVISAYGHSVTNRYEGACP